MPMLSEMTDVEFSSAARYEFAQSTGVLAIAVLGSSTVDRVMAAATSRETHYPHEFFVSKDAALTWLRDFIKIIRIGAGGYAGRPRGHAGRPAFHDERGRRREVPAVVLFLVPQAAARGLGGGDLESGVPVEVGEFRVGLHGHEDELEAFEFAGALERSDHERPHAAGADEVADGGVGCCVVSGDEDIQRLSAGFTGHQGAGEGGVEGLDHVGAGGDQLRDVLGGGVARLTTRESKVSKFTGLVMSTTVLPASVSP